MREILFRGKRQDNGEWITGHLLRYEDGRARINPSHTDIFCYEKDESIIQAVWFLVDPATVGQYTGLTDKNGKMIFEGDIIRTSKYGVDNGRGQNHSGSDVFSVGYADGTYTLENRLRRFCLRPDNGAEVAGNIYDDPKLLRGADNDAQ